MGEVLSQNEIDNLLAALSSGEVDAEEMKGGNERQVKDYDFARPAKFSKEHLRTLEIIFDKFVVPLQKTTSNHVTPGKSYAYGQSITTNHTTWYYLGKNQWIRQFN